MKKITSYLPLFYFCILAVNCQAPSGQKKQATQKSIHNSINKYFKAIEKLDYPAFEKYEHNGHTHKQFHDKYQDHFYARIQIISLSPLGKNENVDYYHHQFIMRKVRFKAQKVQRDSNLIMNNLEGNMILVKFKDGPYKSANWLIEKIQLSE